MAETGDSTGRFDLFLEKLLSLLFSKNKKEERMLILLLTVGFIIRLFASLNMNVTADDMVYASQSAGVINAKILSTHSHPALFFYLTDFAYKIFGYTTFASRLFPLIAGTMLILVVFLIAKLFFNKKIALFAAGFVSLSSFLTRMVFTEQGLITLFFSFSGVYFGLLYLKSENSKVKFLITSAIFFGLGLLTKYNAAFFLISFLLFSAYYIKSKKIIIFSKTNLKKLLVFFAIIILFALPFLSFNYFMYKEKGFMDYQFNKIFKPEKGVELNKAIGGHYESLLQDVLNPSNYVNYKLVYRTDLIIFIFGLLGLLIIPFILQSANILPKHYAFMHILFAMAAGYGAFFIFEKIKNIPLKIIFILILLALMGLNLGNTYGTPHDLFNPSATSSLKSFINTNVKSEDMILFDSRIYTARYFWLAMDHNFLNINQFIDFYKYDQNITGQKSLTNVYVVECVFDDCGWGTINSNPELNKSSELILDSLRAYSKKNYSFYEYNYQGNEFIDEKERVEEYRVYTLSLEMNPNLIKQTKSINSFFLAPYMYLNMKDYLYNYDVYGLSKLVEDLSLWVIYLSMLLFFLSCISLIVWFIFDS